MKNIKEIAILMKNKHFDDALTELEKLPPRVAIYADYIKNGIDKDIDLYFNNSHYWHDNMTEEQFKKARYLINPDREIEQTNFSGYYFYHLTPQEKELLCGYVDE